MALVCPRRERERERERENSIISKYSVVIKVPVPFIIGTTSCVIKRKKGSELFPNNHT
jgi:hypothetical protein